MRLIARLASVVSLFSLLCVTSFSQVPELNPITVDFHQPSDKYQWHIKTSEGQNGLVQRFLFYNGLNPVNTTGLTFKFYMGAPKSLLLADVTGTVSGMSGRVTFNSDFLARPVREWYSAIVLRSGTTEVFTAKGLITILDSPELSALPLDINGQINWGRQKYIDTESSGPYRFPGYITSTNSDGSVSVAAPSGSDTNAWHIGGVVTNAIDALARLDSSNSWAWINAFVTNDLLRTAAIATWTTNDLSGVTWSNFVQGTDSRLTDARTPLAHTQDYSTISNAPWLTSYTETDPVAATSVWNYAQYPLALTNASAFATAEQGTNARPTTSTLESVVANGGTVVSNAVTIDAANARTNTYGGELVILGERLQTPTGNASGRGAISLGGTSSATGDLAVALGVNAAANHDGSVVITAGAGFISRKTGEIALSGQQGVYLPFGPLTLGLLDVGAGAALGSTAIQPNSGAYNLALGTNAPSAWTDDVDNYLANTNPVAAGTLTVTNVTGGTATNSTLTLQATTGNPSPTAVGVRIAVGTNGAVSAYQAWGNGNTGIATAPVASTVLKVGGFTSIAGGLDVTAGNGLYIAQNMMVAGAGISYVMGSLGIKTNATATPLDVNGAATVRGSLNMVNNSVTNASDGNYTNTLATVRSLTESKWTPVALTSATTVTISRVNGSMCSLLVTNSPCTITMSATDWTTNDVGTVSLELWAGTNSLTWDTSKINWATAYVGNTTGTVSVILRKPWRSAIWGGRQ